MKLESYVPLFVACASGIFSLLVALWVAARSARTSKEIETLKAKLSEGIEETKGRVAYRSAVELGNRKNKLDRVNLQLKQLYGPLYALAHGSHRAWQTFRSIHGPHGVPFWDSVSKPSDADAKAWRLWMSTVFMPLNVEMERLVLANMDLLFGDRMEECLIDLCAHVEAYKTVMERWKAEDFSVHTTPLDFPGDALRKYVFERYVELRREQQQLLSDTDEYSQSGRLPDRASRTPVGLIA